jgi:transcription elongation factor GreB
VSRAFVKESDNEREPSIERPRREHPYYVTASGLAKLRGALKKAAKDGNEREAEELERRLDAAVTIDPKTQPHDVVAFGATVTLELTKGERQTYEIVGEDEADPMHGSISWLSPLARALMDRGVGEKAVWQRPAGNVSVRILSIEYR